jgi:hypothetical protein
MAGTASTVRSWLLLEHPGPWGRHAFAGDRLPDGFGRELTARCRSAGVRPLLIRRVGPATPGGACFAARSGPGAPWIERARLARIEDALDLDLEGLGRGRRLGLEPHDGALFLVCTHGRHDVCCAERGRPLAAALAAAYPVETWESSHVGGDRFAGNLVAFPHGLYLGRVDPGDAATVAGAYLAGRISLPHLRGRSCHPMPVQAAEHALRLAEGIDGVDDVAVERIEDADDGIVATFQTTRGAWAVHLAIERSGPAFLTCHSRAEETAPDYRVVAIERPGPRPEAVPGT